MAKEGGKGWMQVFQCFLRLGRAFCKLNFQPCTDLALNLDKGRILGDGKHAHHHGLILPIFLTMKMKLDLDKFWYKVRQYKGDLQRKFMTIKSETTSQ